MLALVPIDRVIADENDRPGGGEMSQNESRQSAAEFESRPGRAGEYALVGGAMPWREVSERAENVSDSSSPGGQQRTDQERGEPLVGGVGEMQGQNLHQRVRLGW
jgi:hypothetical protein